MGVSTNHENPVENKEVGQRCQDSRLKSATGGMNSNVVVVSKKIDAARKCKIPRDCVEKAKHCSLITPTPFVPKLNKIHVYHKPKPFCIGIPPFFFPPIRKRPRSAALLTVASLRIYELVQHLMTKQARQHPRAIPAQLFRTAAPEC